MSLMRSSRFAHLSPKQLVPQLADEGLYLGSESTFYRLQRRHELRTVKRAMCRRERAIEAFVRQSELVRKILHASLQCGFGSCVNVDLRMTFSDFGKDKEAVVLLMLVAPESGAVVTTGLRPTDS